MYKNNWFPAAAIVAKCSLIQFADVIFDETLTFTAGATDPQCFEGIPVVDDTIFEGLPEALEGTLLWHPSAVGEVHP